MAFDHHAQDLVRLTLRPLSAGTPAHYRIRAALKTLLRRYRLKVEKQEFLPREAAPPFVVEACEERVETNQKRKDNYCRDGECLLF